MNSVRMQLTRHVLNYVKFVNNVRRMQRIAPIVTNFSTIAIDTYNDELFERRQLHDGKASDNKVQYFTDSHAQNKVSNMSPEDLNDLVAEFLSKNKDKKIEDLILECQSIHRIISSLSLKKMFRHYSINGKTDMVVILQNYCAKVDPILFKRNGEFQHYLAKAQCMKGNSEKGLSILMNSYRRNENLRSFYRVILRELIQDSVLNRSEASLVIFKKYVLDFSKTFLDHYPLVCFWHICWASTWYSDQILSNELLEASDYLLQIIGDKAGAFSTISLRDYNDDAVVRLLQIFLKHDMMSEYVTVLQILFNYKLKSRDIRGCQEIIRNCEVLGITLPSEQQGRYIKMVIEGKPVYHDPTKKIPSRNFKLNF